MSPNEVTLIAGLGGALIGGAGAWVAQAIAAINTRKADQRRERVELIARFEAATERIWRGDAGRQLSLQELKGASDRNQQKAVEFYAAQMIKDQDASVAAHADAAMALAEIRVLEPSLADTAKTLFEASNTYDLANAASTRATREQAVTAYEAAARKLLGVKDAAAT